MAGLAAVAALAAVAFVAVELINGERLNHITSDRTERVQDTTRVISHHPVIGVGIAGQPHASRELAGSDRPTANFVSHTTPLTVAAELGAIGLALYIWLLVGGVRLIEQVLRPRRALGLALGGVVRGAVRARALLQRLPRGPDHLAGARGRRPAGCRGRQLSAVRPSAPASGWSRRA